MGTFLQQKGVYKGWGDPRGGEYHGFGIMQVDKYKGDKSLLNDYGKRELDPFSERHIEDAAKIYLQKLSAVKAAYPKLSEEQQQMTALSRYNGGAGKPYPDSDQGTTGRDYANDTMVRARWFAQNWENIGK